MGLTTDPNEPCLQDIKPDGQQCCYLVLSEEERAKGFVMPVHRSYTHLKCGSVTTMGLALCETYARSPKFYGGTFCCACGSHCNLREYRDLPEGVIDPTTGINVEYVHTFEWPDGTPVGSMPEEAEKILADRKAAETARHAGDKI